MLTTFLTAYIVVGWLVASGTVLLTAADRDITKINFGALVLSIPFWPFLLVGIGIRVSRDA